MVNTPTTHNVPNTQLYKELYDSNLHISFGNKETKKKL